MRQNRRKAETQIKKAEKQIKQNRVEAERTVRDLVERLQSNDKAAA